MRRVSLAVLLVSLPALAAEGPVERWAKAGGGREKIAAVRTIYREGTLSFGGGEGSIKVWHTAEGKYRKEEKIAAFSSIETFDGTTATVQRGAAAAQALAGPELAIARSKGFTNANAMFLVFFPERRRGSVTVDGDAISFTPEGGVEWKVTLDPHTSLPRTMTHQEGERTILVEFTSYETVDGITLEKEIHRSMGDPRFNAVIRFTRTLINPPVDEVLFRAPKVD